MFQWNICNGCRMPTEDAYSSGHLVLSHFGTYMCSYVETNISWTCIVSGVLSFEQLSVPLFWFVEWKSRMILLYLADRGVCEMLVPHDGNITTQHGEIKNRTFKSSYMSLTLVFFISTAQTFHSSVLILHLYLSMEFLSYNFYTTHRFALLCIIS